jgi:RND family efflux transporter MFP subunit
MMEQTPVFDPEATRENEATRHAGDRRRRRLYLLLGLSLVVLLSSIALIARARRDPAPAGAPSASVPPAIAIEVTSASAVERNAPQSVEIVGSLAADEEVVVAAQVAGELSALSVDFGSYVQQGQVIAQIDRKNADLKVEQAQATLDQTMARLGMKEGERFDPQQNADVKVAKASLDQAKLDLDRSSRLIENGDIARSVHDQALTTFNLNQARYQAALDAVRQQLALVEQQRATIALARKEVADTLVRAPIGGVVKEKHASRGSYLPVNGRIATIVRINPLRVRAEIPEAWAARVRTGQATQLTVEALPGRTFTARVVRIGASLNEQTRALTVEAEVANPGLLLRPGMFAKAELITDPGATSVFVPQRAIQTVSGLSKAFVIENGVVGERIVKTGLADGELIEITEGIRAGEIVATSNLDKLQTGTTVNNQRSPVPGL